MAAAGSSPSEDALDAILHQIASTGRLGSPTGEGPAAVSFQLEDVARRIEEISALAADADARYTRAKSRLKVLKAQLRLAMDITMRDDPYVKFARNQRTKESRARAKHAEEQATIDRHETAVANFDAVRLACKTALESLHAARSTIQTRANVLISERGGGAYRRNF
jgi:hypothetical protein